MNALELLANALNALSIFLAGRNSVHTWWVGILSSLLFARVFASARLYADVTLQLFFVGSSFLGWARWRRGADGVMRPIRRTPWRALVAMALAGAAVALGYGWLLHRFTDAYAPVLDSAVLVLSVVGQLLLVARRLESWWCWLVVNTICVPLYAARGLWVTAVLYLSFWVNAVVTLRRWRRLVEPA